MLTIPPIDYTFIHSRSRFSFDYLDVNFFCIYRIIKFNAIEIILPVPVRVIPHYGNGIYQVSSLG